MHYLIAILLSFCLTVSPGSAWDCDYTPNYGATCDNHTSDTYYRAYTRSWEDGYGQLIIITATNGDDYSDVVSIVYP